MKRVCELAFGSSPRVHREGSRGGLLAFLRYDYKKILARTRYLYIDRNFDATQGELQGGDLEFGFFEPILLCFPNLEFLGRLRFSSEVAWSPEHPKTREILGKSLESMGRRLCGTRPKPGELASPCSFPRITARWRMDIRPKHRREVWIPGKAVCGFLAGSTFLSGLAIQHKCCILKLLPR